MNSLDPFDTPSDTPSKGPGYHVRKIARGEFGELSKVLEEVEEAMDFDEQDNRLGVLIELSDVLGAIQGYLKKNVPGFTVYDLLSMANATRRAFENGHR